jgi:hypothetical protein
MLLISALVALAPLAAPQPEPPREHTPTCEIAAIRSDRGAHGHTHFSATRILELRFETLLEVRPKQQRRLRLRLYTPDGFLYQVLQTKPARQGEQRRFQARLPVAGTSIMASGLYGRWKVVPYLDDAQKPCGRGQSFVIRP